MNPLENRDTSVHISGLESCVLPFFLSVKLVSCLFHFQIHIAGFFKCDMGRPFDSNLAVLGIRWKVIYSNSGKSPHK